MWTAVIAILTAAQLALAEPVNDGRIKEDEHEPSYVASPMGRGTMDVMFTCVITLSLCVWTAVHPNIIARSTYMGRLKYKVLYVVLGLFSPEIVLSEAFNEWRAARNLRDWLHRKTAEKILKNAVKKAAVLGGFPVPNSDSPSDNGDQEKQNSVVTEYRPPSDADARVRKTHLGLWEAAREASRESTASDESKLRRCLRDAAASIWKKVEDAIGDSSKEGNDPEKEGGSQGVPARPVPPTQEENDRVKRTLKQLAALDKATKNYRSAKRISEARKELWLYGLGRWVIECLPFASPSEEETPTFTMEIAFFIVMGGLTFSPIDHLKYRHYERTLSARGFTDLVENGVVDPMRLLELKVDIQDKGKSDILAKVLVCAQASWMMINCLLRKAAGLPITVIELNVIVHVMSMIAIYACWWKKPHDAGMPIPLNIFLENQAVCSLLFTQGKDPKKVPTKPETPASGTGETSSPVSSIQRRRSSQQDHIGPAGKNLSPGAHTTPAVGAPGDDAPEVDLSMTPWIEREEDKKVKTRKKEIEPTSAEYLLISEDAEKAKALECCANIGDIKDITTLPGRFEFRSLVVVLIPLCLIYGGIHASLWNTYFPTTIERWLWRASACIVGIPGLGSAAIWGVKIIITRDLGEYKKTEIKNPFTTIFMMIVMILSVILLFALCITLAAVPLGAMGGVIYGGILGHRKIMKLAVKWRVMCYFEFLCSIALGVVISGAGFVLAVVGGIKMSAAFFRRFGGKFREILKVPLAVALVVAALFVIVYCGARAFILVETFICLRSLPKGAYKTVRWDEFWPHL